MISTPTPTRTEGRLRLHAERVGNRTRLTELECHAPLQLMRCHYLDRALPDMAYATVTSPSGGVLQGDRLAIVARVSAGARLHLDTPSALRLYRMPDRPAAQEVTLIVEAGGFLEYLPDPTIPFARSDFASRTALRVDAAASAIVVEAVTAGRVASGETHGYHHYESLVEIARPNGDALAVDATILDPADGLGLPGRLGRHAAAGTLYAVHPGLDADCLRAAASRVAGPGTTLGASTLPHGLGAWLKVLGPDGPAIAAVLAAAAAAAHQEILGEPAPASRRP
jgi:urease accessory protein